MALGRVDAILQACGITDCSPGGEYSMPPLKVCEFRLLTQAGLIAWGMLSCRICR